MKKYNNSKQRPIGYGIAIASLIWSILVFILGFFMEKADISWWIVGSLFIIWLIILTCLFIIDKQNRELNHLDELIKEGTYGLVESYNQLSNLEKEKKYLEFFKQFVRYEEYVIGVQTYNYYLSSSRGKTNIRIEYDNGYVEGNQEINAIIQGEYIFNKRDVLTLRKGIYQNRLLDNTTLLQSLFFRKLESINELFPEDYAIISLAERELTQALGVDVGDLPQLHKSKKQISHKRLGIAKAILTFEFLNLSTYFGFSYRGKNNSKDRRHYSSFIVESSTGTKKLYLIVYQSEHFHSDDDIILLEEKIISSFKNLLGTNGLIERAEDLDNNKRGDIYAFLQKVRQNF
jgi:hypothetical protein